MSCHFNKASVSGMSLAEKLGRPSMASTAELEFPAPAGEFGCQSLRSSQILTPIQRNYRATAKDL
jgi:hypothetical protein